MSARRRSGAGFALAALGVLALGVLIPSVLVPGAPASALPPEGAGPDTPGTSSSVSPRTLEPCDTISFQVRGFPAGETLYIKIDDGIGYGDSTVQGGGVWHMQAIGSSGSVSGSFELSCDIAPGSHWLRFLASREIYEEGVYKGVLGFTLRGGSDFTVVAPRGGAASPGARPAPEAGTTVGEGAEQMSGQGGVLVIEPGPTPTPSESPTPEAEESASPEPSAVPTPIAAPPEPDDGFPVVGLIGAGAVLLAGGVAAALLLRRRASP